MNEHKTWTPASFEEAILVLDWRRPAKKIIATLSMVVTALFACLYTTGISQAKTWPSRPILLLVPTGPGAATDIIARLIAQGLSQRLGTPVVVENRPGASGIVAHEAAARAPADGYTLLFSGTTGLAANLVTFKKLPYDPVNDFEAVSIVSNLGPQMLSASATLPVKSFPELVAYAKANPGKLSIGFDATAGTAVVATKLLNKHANLGLVEVPYRTAAQLSQDTAAGTNQLMMLSIAASRSVIDSGKARPLAISSKRRFPTLPDLPTLNEFLPDDVAVDGWFAVLAPKAVPADIVSRVSQALVSIVAEPKIRQSMLNFGILSEGASTPAEARDYIHREQDRWRAMAAQLDIQPQ